MPLGENTFKTDNCNSCSCQNLLKPWYKPALWEQDDGNNPALSPALLNRKSNRDKGPNVKPSVLPWRCGDNQREIALHLSPAIPVGVGREYK